MKPLLDPSKRNVHGLERGASLAGGLALLGSGLRHGGLLGAAGVLLGGLLLARGGSGRCELKRVLSKEQTARPQTLQQRARYSHMPLDSEVHSPDFNDLQALPDSTPMGHEGRGA